MIGVVVPCNEWKLSILQSGLQHFLIIDAPGNLRQCPDANCNINLYLPEQHTRKIKYNVVFLTSLS